MVANVIAGLSLVLSIVLALYYYRDRAHAKYQLEFDYITGLLQWHPEVVNTLIKLRLIHHAEKKGASYEDLAVLSALIEQGRFYFPNIDRHDGFGEEKPPAYRGYRNLALDFLVASYDLFRADATAVSNKKAESLQRHFTAIVFEVVRPKKRLLKIQSLTGRYFIQEKSLEDFLLHQDSSALEHVWLQRHWHA